MGIIESISGFAVGLFILSLVCLFFYNSIVLLFSIQSILVYLITLVKWYSLVGKNCGDNGSNDVCYLPICFVTSWVLALLVYLSPIRYWNDLKLGKTIQERGFLSSSLGSRRAVWLCWGPSPAPVHPGLHCFALQS